jgi:Xaa-Pro aminopeptidase
VSPGIGPSDFVRRVARAQAALAACDATALLIGVGPELEWLAGYRADGHERLNLLVIPAHGAATFIAPRLELAAAEQAPGLGTADVRLQPWAEADDPYPLIPPLLAAHGAPTTGAYSAPGAGVRLLISDSLRGAFLLRLQGVLPEATWDLASEALAPLRRVKDDAELALLSAAARAADRVVAAVTRGPLIGRTEAQVAREVRERLVDEGHDTAEFAIVASGPNSASPHHEPSGRVIRAGEPLLLDIGGRLGGYFSDITRTVWVAGADDLAPDDRFREIHALVEQAQSAGREAVRPGVSFGVIDAAARSVITAGGFGEEFFHRLGHGIGLEVHEEPWVIAGSEELAVAGNTFSVEPGIYLEGRYGVRIEDAVVCTPDGCLALNEAPRELHVVSGV